MGEFIAQSNLKWFKTPPYPANVQMRDVEPPEGFDEGFERSTFPAGAGPASVQRYYFKKGPDRGHRDLAGRCNVSESGRVSCILHFSLACDPRIYVSIHGLDGSFLPQVSKIREKTNDFISGMVKKPPCHL